MNKLTYVFVCALLSLLSLTGLAQRPANTIDAYATFSEMRANAHQACVNRLQEAAFLLLGASTRHFLAPQCSQDPTS